MLSANYKKEAKSKQEGTSIINGREKIEAEQLIGSTVTIEDVEKRKGDNGIYYAVTLKEYPDNFIFSGSALTNLIADAEEAGEDIRGEMVQFQEKKKTKGGRWFLPVDLV